MPDYSKYSDQEVLTEYLNLISDQYSNLATPTNKLQLIDLFQNKNLDQAYLKTHKQQLLWNLTREIHTRINHELPTRFGKITKVDDLKNKLSTYFHGQTTESLLILGIDSNSNLIDYYQSSSQDDDQTAINVQTITRWCLNNHSRAVIMAHNHPNQNVKPSINDLNISKELQNALLLFNILLLDSIVVTDRDYYSLAQNHQIS